MSTKILPEKEFIDRVSKIHNNLYDYSKCNFTGTHKPITIICKKHGEFLQLGKNHLKGNKCPKCSVENRFITNEDFIKKSINIHGDKYDYSNSIYKSYKKKVEIKCKKCNNIFYQTPNNHLSGDGCPFCKNIQTSKRCTSNTIDFIKKAVFVHKNRYNYSKSDYVNNHTEITIVCKKHGNFKQLPSVHLNGSGCSKCVSVVSKPETHFLNMLKVMDRQKFIKPYKVDGVSYENKIIYEFLGDFWHGNPKKYNFEKVNQINKKTFGELYNATLLKFDTLKKLGYTIKYIWESDWNNFRNGIDKTPNIITL
jgi:Zn finger protein HypA/HybF involved in hydrogenase expression